MENLTGALPLGHTIDTYSRGINALNSTTLVVPSGASGASGATTANNVFNVSVETIENGFLVSVKGKRTFLADLEALGPLVIAATAADRIIG